MNNLSDYKYPEFNEDFEGMMPVNSGADGNIVIAHGVLDEELHNVRLDIRPCDIVGKFVILPYTEDNASGEFQTIYGVSTKFQLTKNGSVNNYLLFFDMGESSQKFVALSDTGYFAPALS